MVAISMFLFGYTVLIGWGYYGEQFFEYIFGPRIIVPYRWFYCFLIPFGAMFKVDLVWNWGDIVNGLQVFPTSSAWSPSAAWRLRTQAAATAKQRSSVLSEVACMRSSRRLALAWQHHS